MMRCPKVSSRGKSTAIQKRFRRELWSRERRRVKRGGKPGNAKRHNGKVVVIRLAAPLEFSLANPGAREETIRFLTSLRDRSRTPGIHLVLDFSGVEKMTPAGSVLLTAEIDRALAGDETTVQAKVARHPIIHQVLEQIGIYHRLGIKCDTVPVDENVIHWRPASGVLSDGQTSGTLLDNYDGRLAEGIRRGLYAGIVEAMTNTVHHAYDGEEGRRLKQSIGRRWWMLSQEKDGQLTVAICDLGIGIPRSLPRSSSFPHKAVRELWSVLGLDNSDASAIRVAIEMGKTRTKLKGRGKGLSDIVDAVNLSPEGSVYLASNRGVFTCHKGTTKARNHSNSIRGTLVHWVVPVAPSDS